MEYEIYDIIRKLEKYSKLSPNVYREKIDEIELENLIGKYDCGHCGRKFISEKDLQGHQILSAEYDGFI